MVQSRSIGIDQNLRLGIDAARTGHDQAAKQHLLAVLKQDPDNIPAMLWLAFVLPSPHNTIRVLNRVLALEPDNERAIAGVRWARGRLGLEAEPTVQKSTDRKEPPATTVDSQPVELAEATPSRWGRLFWTALTASVPRVSQPASGHLQPEDSLRPLSLETGAVSPEGSLIWPWSPFPEDGDTDRL